MSDRNATLLGKIVQSNTAETCSSSAPLRPQHRKARTIPMKMTAFLGCPLWSTLPIQVDPGRIPSRAIAETRREAATMAMLIFYLRGSARRYCEENGNEDVR